MEFNRKEIIFTDRTVHNFEGAIRGMRNPMNSWDRSDSIMYVLDVLDACNNSNDFHEILKIIGNTAICFKLGENDFDLIKRLIRGGTEHRKFMRSIFVSVDIAAPRYWWVEFDTYKIGTVASSCSTMHKIHERELTHDDFVFITDQSLVEINEYIRAYQNEKNFINLTILKSLLPEGFIQKRTVSLNYENIFNIYQQRKNHRLKEWSYDFINWVETLPYMKMFLRELKNE